MNTASALTLDSVSGSWANAGPDTPSCLNIANSDGGSFVSYGVPLEGDCPEGVDFSRQSGFGFEPVPGVNFAPGLVFALGEFTHYNRFIYDEEPLNFVDLVIDLNFSAPAGLSTELVYTVNLEETLNIPGTCEYGSPGDIPCPDRVSFASTVGDKTFIYNDIEYTLQLIGFAPKTGATCEYSGAINQFITQEDQENTACLFGRVVANDASIEISQTLAQAQPLRPGTNADFDILIDNTGTLSFDQIEIAGTACDVSPVYVSGDTNNDGLLDPGETWVYRCQAGAVAESFINTVMVGVSRLDATRIDRLVDLPVEVARLSTLTVVKSSDLGWGPQFHFAFASGPSSQIFDLNVGQQTTLAELMPGTYRVVEEAMAGWPLGTVNCEGARQSGITRIENGVQINLAQAENITCTFVATATPGTIRVLSHQIPRGSDETDGPRLQGWRYTLYAGGRAVSSLTTDASGAVQWDGLHPGTYTVCQETPFGWVNRQPGGDACYTATFGEPDFARTFRFGNLRLDPICEMSLNGMPLGGAWSRPWQGDNDTLTLRLTYLSEPVGYYWEMARYSEATDEAPVASGSGEFSADGTYTIPFNYPAEGGWGQPSEDGSGRYTLQVTLWIDAPCSDVNWRRWYDAPFQADLALSGSGPGEAQPEDEVAYGFGIVNRGPYNAEGVRLQINLPAGLRLVAAPDNCGADGGSITCRWDRLGYRQTAGVEIRAVVTAEGRLSVTAGADAAQPPDPDGSNNRVELVTVSELPPPPPGDDDDDDNDQNSPPVCSDEVLLEAIEAGIITPPLPNEQMPVTIIRVPGRAICRSPVIFPFPQNNSDQSQELDETDDGVE